MKKAVVVYRSHSGVTRRYAEEIGAYLGSRGVESRVASVGECDPASLAAADFVLLGCWTAGLMVIRQHPDLPWLAFVRDIPPTPGPKTAVFTTYKLATGSQFPKMRAALAGHTAEPALELKSRNGRMSDADRAALDAFIA
jgi:flavodoxin